MNYIQCNNYSNTFVFDTGIEGKTIAIFGGIHGNEIAGIGVVDKVRDQLENGSLVLLKGKLILAYGNEEAIKIQKKEYKYNLNRLFRKEYLESESNEYEIIRIKQLSEIMKSSDLLLDIHSVSSDSEAFMFCENINNEISIANKIYNGNTIVGWGDIAGDLISGDTDSYMHSLGKVSFTLECGNHNCSNAINVGYDTTLNLLNNFGFINKEVKNITTVGNHLFEMYKIERTITGLFKFDKKKSNFEAISKGELIGLDGDREIRAEEDFIILLPNYEKIRVGEEIFYYGRKLK